MENSQKIEVILQEIIKDANERISYLLSLCESQIEQLFLINAYCYFLKGSYNFYNVSLICDIAKTNFDPITKLGKVLSFFHFVDDDGNPTQVKGFEVTGGNFSYKFFPQFRIETPECEFRLDVAVIYEYTFLDGPTKGQTLIRKFGVECDGFEFHSTKDQQTNDNKRTRKLMELGWTILRYSGQEIHRMKSNRDFASILMTLDNITDNNH